MPDSFTPNLHLALQVTGENNGTWGTDLNANVISTIDSVLGRFTSIPLSGSNVTLSVTDTQNFLIQFTGVLTANVTVTFPGVGRVFCLANLTTGNFTVTVALGSSTVVLTQNTTSLYLSTGFAIGPLADVHGPNGATTGNLPMFLDSTGKILVDSGLGPPVIATQPQAETGTANNVYNTPLRTAQQTTARLASQGQAQGGTDNNALMTPLRTSQAIQVQASGFPSASADPNNVDYPLGAVLAASGSINRNQACNLYLDATDSTAYRITSNGSLMLNGTWLSCGRVGSSILARRIS